VQPPGVEVCQRKLEGRSVNVWERHLAAITCSLAEATGQERPEIVGAGAEHSAVGWKAPARTFIPHRQRHVREGQALAALPEPREVRAKVGALRSSWDGHVGPQVQVQGPGVVVVGLQEDPASEDQELCASANHREAVPLLGHCGARAGGQHLPP